MDTSTALARVDDGDNTSALAMVSSPQEAKARLAQLQAFVKGVMRRGEDYDQIPGTNKPTLLKPGAEKLAEIYGLSPTFTFEEKREEWDALFFYYVIRCTLTRGGRTVAEGLGSCNSREDRYAWRWVWAEDLPKDTDRSALKSKSGTGKGGRRWTKYRLPNEDLPSQVNTILKMAKKRAYVDAVISATRSSGVFTQDVEDMPDFSDLEQDEDRDFAGEVRAAIAAAKTLDDLSACKRQMSAAKKHIQPEAWADLIALGQKRHAEMEQAEADASEPEPGSAG